jgi:signal transduction histidine kinase
MNKLWTRLAAAFLIVALVAVGAVAVVVNRTTASSFRSYVGQQNAAAVDSQLVQALEAHYASVGSWEGAQDLLPGQQGGHGQGQGRGGQGPRFLLANADYTVVAATDPEQIGHRLSTTERDQAQALVVAGETVGYLIRGGAGVQVLDQTQQKFLSDMTRALVLAALGAIVLAVVMGLALSWALARPLRHLQQSAAAITQGNLGTQMPILGTQEFRDVASAFNRMSAALAESEVIRGRMTSDIAHELRSPVSVMRGQLEAMLDGVFPLSTEQLAIVYDQTLHLGRLVEDLRTLTRAESGRLPLELSPVEPGQLVQRVVADFAPLAQDQGITLRADVAPDLSPIPADPDRLRQVLANLVANALIHTPGGGEVTVAVANYASAVRFTVSDTGPGLTPEQAAHVFERFYRTDDARQRDQGGSGLGLAIAHELVRLHRGRIWVDSVPGKGSAFNFEIPAEARVPLPPQRREA